MQYKTLFMQQLLQFRPSLGALNEPEAILTNRHWKTFISFSTVSLPSAKLVWLAVSKTGLLHALVNMYLATLASINTGSIMLCLIFHGTHWEIPTHWLDRLHGLKLFKSINNKSVLIEEYIRDRYSEKHPNTNRMFILPSMKTVPLAIVTRRQQHWPQWWPSFNPCGLSAD